MSTGALTHARTVADAVLYEGYLLYPYRATSSKNMSRWQFGVLGPPGAAAAGHGEDPRMSTQLLVRTTGPGAVVSAHLRFLQLQSRTARARTESGEFAAVDELKVGARSWLTWDEAAEQEPPAPTWPLDALAAEREADVEIPGGQDVEAVHDDDGLEAGRLIRTRRALHAVIRVRAEPVGADVLRLCVDVENLAEDAADAAASPASAIAASLIGAHLLLSVENAEFLSMTDPPADAAQAAAECTQHRCWPVLAGVPGDTSLMLVSPIILYDHPEVAEQSAGALFDSTEIDEILTLRIMTMTDEEKATARATDPKAAEIIDRCDAMSPDTMAALHGVLRNPHAADAGPLDPFGPESGLVTFDADTFDADTFVAGPPDAFGNDLSATVGFNGEVPWWDPAVDSSVDPFSDSVRVRGVTVAAGSIVRLHPSRRSDAQDIFYADQIARVAAVHTDVDGETYIAVILVDDPAADMHEQAGRYLHFAPDEIEPMPANPPVSGSNRISGSNEEESRP